MSTYEITLVVQELVTREEVWRVEATSRDEAEEMACADRGHKVSDITVDTDSGWVDVSDVVVIREED